MEKRLFIILAVILLFATMLTSCVDNFVSIEVSADGYFVINGEKTNNKVPFADRLIDDNKQGLEFFLNEEGTYAVEIGNAKYLSRIEIPAVFQFIAVTEIGDFSSKSLKELVIPNTVKKISNFAFEDCRVLESLRLPDSVVKIGKGAFSGCAALVEIVIPGSVGVLEASTFDGCTSLDVIFYKGTEEQWQAISVNLPESLLEGVTVHCNFRTQRWWQ